MKGNLAEIQPKNHQNVPKTHSLQKVPGVNGLKIFTFSYYANEESDDVIGGPTKTV